MVNPDNLYRPCHDDGFCRIHKSIGQHDTLFGPQDFIKTCSTVPKISGKFRAILLPCVKKSVEKTIQY